MTSPYQLDLTVLRAAREKLRRKHDAEAAVRRAGYAVMADQISAEAAKLSRVTVTVDVPCLLCQHLFPMDVPVGASWVPNCIICGPCDARVTSEYHMHTTRGEH